MTTQANISGWKFYIGSGSPSNYSAVEEVFEVSGAGQTNDLEQVTNFDSPEGQHEYIGGLADGDEVTIQANYVPGATHQKAMVAAVAAKVNRDFRIAYTRPSPDITMDFEGVPLHWSIVPSATGRNVIQFRVKISAVAVNDFAGSPTP